MPSLAATDSTQKNLVASWCLTKVVFSIELLDACTITIRLTAGMVLRLLWTDMFIPLVPHLVCAAKMHV